MKKLKNKVFLTIFLILTISIISIITIFNIQNYIKQKEKITNNLNMAYNNAIPKPRNNQEPKKDIEIKEPIDENIKFMDSIIYTVLLDDNNSIKDIINHSSNSLDTEKITSLATSILNKKNIKEKYIGNLYTSTYSYTYIKNNSLTIFDNKDVRSNLLSLLKTSILIFTFLEVFVFIISKKITTWIIVPVKNSFDKQKRFIADASHELKTPLSVILASSEMLSKNPNELKWLNNIKEEASRMNLLINDLLTLASTEEVKTYNFSLGNLSKLVELSTLTFEGIAFEKNINIKYDIQENIMFNMDENKIKELIEILLDNAIKHSFENSSIKVSLKQDKHIVLIVSNQGKTISKEEKDKIFERFYRVDKGRNRSENRYGLGLSIALNIVLNHNGEISVDSKNNTTCFKVLFK